MHGQPPATVDSFTSIKFLLSAALTVLIICFAGFDAAAQDKLAFESGDTLDQIRAKIKHNGYSFSVGHTWVYDLPPEEQAKMFKLRPAPAPEKRTIAPNTDIILKATEPAQTSFDWRSYNGHSYIGPIRNQGENGTCYAFGACAAAESTYNFKNGLYDLNCADFSEMYIIWTLGSVKPYHGRINQNNTGAGAGPDYYDLYALTKAGAPEGAVGFEGICSEANFPYSDSVIPPKPSAIEASKNFPRVTFKQWNRVFPTNYADTTEQIKTAISTYGAVDVAVAVDSAFLAYTSGIYE
ncbi:MAG: C1 family peptidase, partial [Syntrophobacteraceae bacterium]